MQTSITSTFKDGTVLVTGSTGFLGKLLTEKLLRSCSVKCIALLVRSKKGLTAEQRVENTYKQSVFDRLHEEKPDFLNYIKVINGNIEKSSLGLSSTDLNWLIENVNFVFHCAATIKFNEPLEFATKINVQGTENVLALAKEMKNLKGFVHVSTAYSHCPRNEIKEQYYSVPITAEQLKHKLKLNEIPPNVLDNWPNTYSFTKAIAENLISSNENHLPISVFRPSIIGCTKAEPSPGWLENMNGPSGVVTGVMVGILRTAPLDEEKVTDIVPADYTVNALISVMWDTVNRYQNVNEIIEEPKIYNYVSSVESPLTWGRFIEGMHNHYREAPPLRSMWYAFYTFYTNLWIGLILRLGLHRIPAIFMDLFLIIRGKNPKMLKMYGKTEYMLDLLHEFATREWKFDNNNTRKLWSLLSKEDCTTFWFSLEEFNWKSYMKSFYYGIRERILNEDISNLPEALSKNRKLYWIHQSFICLIVYLILQILWLIIMYL